MNYDRRSIEQWAEDCAHSLDAARARRERMSGGHPFPARWQEWLVALVVVIVIVAIGVAFSSLDLR